MNRTTSAAAIARDVSKTREVSLDTLILRDNVFSGRIRGVYIVSRTPEPGNLPPTSLINSSVVSYIFKMGIVPSFIDEGFPATSHFSTNDIPDLTGKVIIVTGANAGIGKETARALLDKNAKVYMAARSAEKAKEAIQELKIQTSKEGIFLKLDLADLNSVKAAAKEFLSKEPELHVLFNNAGVMFPRREELTAQGYDTQFGVNALAPFYFTQLLLPALRAGAKSSTDGKSRIINTSSFAGRFVDKIEYNTLTDTPARTKALEYVLYSQSKLANSFISNEMAKRYADDGVISVALHPGFLSSDLLRNLSLWQYAMVKILLYEPSYGALTQLWAGTTPEGAHLNGQYLIPWARVGRCNPAAEDQVKLTQLWNWLELQVQIFEEKS